MKKAKQTNILGIDGGGTKTTMMLTDQDGQILACVKTGPSNIHTVSERQAINNLQRGFISLKKESGLKNIKLSRVAAGFAGIDTETDLRKARSYVKSAFGKSLPETKKVKVVNDTIIGFWSGAETKEGICIIGGTGSNCYGRTKKGKEAWAGGMDYLLADEGSGYEQGAKALKAIAKSSDGRGKKTILERMILKHYQVKTVRDLIPIVYKEGYGKHDIGKLALYVEEAAIKGDAVAKEICLQSAEELFLLTHAVAKQLGFKNQKFPIVLIGGVIQNNPVVKRRFKQLVKKQYPSATFIIPKSKPVLGAIKLAMSL